MKSKTLGLEHRQQQTLSPRLQRAVRLLQMSSMEFSQVVYDCVGNNPFLDADETDDAVPDVVSALPVPGGIEEARELASGVSGDSAEGVPPGVSSADEGAGESAQGSDADDWKIDDRAAGMPRGEDSGVSALDVHAVHETLADHLLGQLTVLPLSQRDRVMAETVVRSLDDDGYLRCELTELATVSGLKPLPSEAELHIALSRVQSLDPAGVGARDVQECLLLQLPELVCPEKRELARVIIRDHLPLLAANDVTGLARVLSCTPAEVQPVLVCIRQLAPRPGAAFGAQHVQYVIPDVVVKKVRGQWTASLNPAVVPKVRLHHTYIDLFQRNRKAQHGDLASHLQEAQWTVHNIEQRFSTILSIAQAIVDRQRHFLEYGPLAMKPLGLREIAEEVGVHESTVSRVTNNKFMASPQGVFELKYFFSRALQTASGGECSATAIRSLITELIAAERPDQPMSDAELARQLARQGIVVARRTVTKYRQALRIESFELRRRIN